MALEIDIAMQFLIEQGICYEATQGGPEDGFDFELHVTVDRGELEIAEIDKDDWPNDGDIVVRFIPDNPTRVQKRSHYYWNDDYSQCFHYADTHWDKKLLELIAKYQTPSKGDKPMKFKTINQAKSGEETLLATLPPGDYVATDPCYVLGDDTYRETLDARYGGDLDSNNDYTIHLHSDEGDLIILSTLIGDGRFSCKVGSEYGELLVDSGQLCVIDKRLLEKDRQQVSDFGMEFSLNKPTLVTVDELSNLTSDAVAIWCTEDEDEDDEDDDYEPYEDEEEDEE